MWPQETLKKPTKSKSGKSLVLVLSSAGFGESPILRDHEVPAQPLCRAAIVALEDLQVTASESQGLGLGAKMPGMRYEAPTSTIRIGDVFHALENPLSLVTLQGKRGPRPALDPPP